MLGLRWALILGLLLVASGCVWLPEATAPAPPTPGTALAPPDLAPLSAQQLRKRLEQTQVLLVGEVHDHPGHHQVQLDMLKAMAELGGPLMVGVEWLDITAQPACDEFSASNLSVEQFAQKVNWEERWGFPLELYAPILELVRAKRLPLLALNAPLEVVRQVARQGLAGLQPDQRALLAPALDLDLEDPVYRRFIGAQFKVHGQGRGPSQENFVAAQVARDETMAWRIAQAMYPWPDGGKRGVVLVGAGHLAHGQGLPTRLARRLPGARLLTVLPVPPQMGGTSSASPMEAPPADILVVSTPAPPPPPRLGVVLKAEPDGLLVERVLPQTPAQRAGVLPGDLLVALDGHSLRQIKQIHDLVKDAPLAAHVYRVRRGGQKLDFAITMETAGR